MKTPVIPATIIFAAGLGLAAGAILTATLFDPAGNDFLMSLIVGVALSLSSVGILIAVPLALLWWRKRKVRIALRIVTGIEIAFGSFLGLLVAIPGGMDMMFSAAHPHDLSAVSGVHMLLVVSAPVWIPLTAIISILLGTWAAMFMKAQKGAAN